MLEAQDQQEENRNDDESKYETIPHNGVSRLRDWMTSEKWIVEAERIRKEHRRKSVEGEVNQWC